EHDIVTAVGEADGGVSILIAAFIAGIVGLIMGIQQKLFSFKEAMSLYVSGFRSMTIVFIILTLAWSIGTITSELGTADYLVDLQKILLHQSLFQRCYLFLDPSLHLLPVHL